MTPRVKDIINIYQKENLSGVIKYLYQDGINIDSSTWAGLLKKDIEDKNIHTVILKIELLCYKFIKTKKDGEETDERPGE